MPFLTGLVFVPPLLVSVWMLSRIPPPREEDVRRRSRRSPMLRADRRRFFALAIGGFAQGWLSDMGFMVLTGVGMYVPYVAFHTTLFERMIAVFRDKSNIGYLMYLADAVGYLGYVGVVPFRSFSQPSPRYLDFFFRSSLLICAVSIILMVLCFLYFRQRIASLGPADGRATRGLAAAAVPPSSGN